MLEFVPDAAVFQVFWCLRAALTWLALGGSSGFGHHPRCSGSNQALNGDVPAAPS